MIFILQERGCTVLSITSNATSPLAMASDAVLTYTIPANSGWLRNLEANCVIGFPRRTAQSCACKLDRGAGGRSEWAGA